MAPGIATAKPANARADYARVRQDRPAVRREAHGRAVFFFDALWH